MNHTFIFSVDGTLLLVPSSMLGLWLKPNLECVHEGGVANRIKIQFHQWGDTIGLGPILCMPISSHLPTRCGTNLTSFFLLNLSIHLSCIGIMQGRHCG